MCPLLDARSRQEYERTGHGEGKRARGMVLVIDAHAATSGARHSQKVKGQKGDRNWRQERAGGVGGRKISMPCESVRRDLTSA